MILPFEPYNPVWKERFETIKGELNELLKPIHPIVEHIGSTAVEGLSAKPIIDIMVGVQDDCLLDQVPKLLAKRKYVYYPKYNADMPYRRFFVLLKETPAVLGLPACIDVEDEIPERMHDHDLRIAHIHVIPISSEHWMRHLAFREYLRTHIEVKEEYQQIKEKLVEQQWRDGNDYNEGKDDFIKREEQKAIAWYTAMEKK